MGLVLKVLHFIFFLYFLTHIPITILVDAMAVIPKTYYPQQVSELISLKARFWQ